MLVKINDRIKARVWYWKLVITLKLLRICLKLSPPSRKQLGEMLVALEKLKERLECE